MNVTYLKTDLKEKNVIWVTPENEEIFAENTLQEILGNLTDLALKYKDESFGMMPKLLNVKLISGEVVEAVACCNFKKGEAEVMGIFLYDQTKNSDELVRAILKKHLNS